MSPQTVLIFGGSSGVGLAVAKLALTHLSTETPNIFISSSSPDKISIAVAELKSTPSIKSDVVINGIAADLSNNATQLNEVERVLQFATEKCRGKIDHIVWTAGDLPTPDIMSNHRGNKDVIWVQTVRIFGPLTLMTLAKEYMNDSRALVKKPVAGRGRIFGASGGLTTAALGLAVELAPIRANSVVLGTIKTPLTDRNTGGSDETYKALAEKTLVKAIADPAEAAEAYLYSMRCAFVTGSEIYCEGGALWC